MSRFVQDRGESRDGKPSPLRLEESSAKREELAPSRSLTPAPPTLLTKIPDSTLSQGLNTRRVFGPLWAPAVSSGQFILLKTITKESHHLPGPLLFCPASSPRWEGGVGRGSFQALTWPLFREGLCSQPRETLPPPTP